MITLQKVQLTVTTKLVTTNQSKIFSKPFMITGTLRFFLSLIYSCFTSLCSLILFLLRPVFLCKTYCCRFSNDFTPCQSVQWKTLHISMVPLFLSETDNYKHSTTVVDWNDIFTQFIPNALKIVLYISFIYSLFFNAHMYYKTSEFVI